MVFGDWKLIRIGPTAIGTLERLFVSICCFTLLELADSGSQYCLSMESPAFRWIEMPCGSWLWYTALDHDSRLRLSSAGYEVSRPASDSSAHWCLPVTRHPHVVPIRAGRVYSAGVSASRRPFTGSWESLRQAAVRLCAPTGRYENFDIQAALTVGESRGRACRYITSRIPLQFLPSHPHIHLLVQLVKQFSVQVILRLFTLFSVRAAIRTLAHLSILFSVQLANHLFAHLTTQLDHQASRHNGPFTGPPSVGHQGPICSGLLACREANLLHLLLRER